MENNIKIVRLQSGHDLIANCSSSTKLNKVILGKPMHIFFRRVPTGQTVMLMTPWLPIEIIKENIAEIYKTDILTIIEPKENLVEYYNDVVKVADEKMNEEVDFGTLEDVDEDDLDEAEEMDDEEIPESIIEERKNSKLH